MSCHLVRHSSATLAGLGCNSVGDFPSTIKPIALPPLCPSHSLPLHLPSSKQCESDTQSGAHTLLQQILEHPSFLKAGPVKITIPPVAISKAYSAYVLPDTPEDTTVSRRRFTEALREWAVERLYATTPYAGVSVDEALHSESADGLSHRTDSRALHNPRSLPSDYSHGSESYFASWEGEDDEDDDGDDDFNFTSSILPNSLSAVGNVDSISFASSHAASIPSPASNGAQTGSLGSFSNDQITAPNAPRLNSSPFPWASQRPTSLEIQIRFGKLFNENGWIMQSSEGEDSYFISSYSSSSDSCPPTPPLSDVEVDQPSGEILGGLYDNV